ncbi:MAG: 2-C-methyl-D-erythritol 2,4-cyclodiphosphate synthase [Firmicutes bacterium]|nr:2-C-methyl-D-erythritol 2,4-cyclodiphosphate synthase [Bacillota bacterium]
MRIGIGYDVHRLSVGRDLIIGGVRIPYSLGLDGHSDADVLVHAVMDAILGALGLGDIGKLFPDTDPAYLGASSIGLLKIVSDRMDQAGYQIGNVDMILIAQKPKISPYTEQMRKNIADALGVTIDRINVKATTEEHLGFTGREEGMAAQAVCLLEEKS